MNQISHVFSPLLLCIALCFAGCVKEIPVSEQAADQLVIDANLIVGSSIEDIHIHGLRGVVSDAEHEGLIVMVSDGLEEVRLSSEEARPGYYSGPSDFVIQPETDYSFRCTFLDKEISSQTSTPPAMTQLSSSKDFLDAQVQNDLVFLEWSGVNSGSFNEYFYMIELLPYAEDQEEIHRFEQGNSSSMVYSYAPELTLSILDFNFYGPHTIKVYAVSKAYEELFAPQSEAAQNGPSNILGGYGYFIGTSLLSGSLEVR